MAEHSRRLHLRELLFGVVAMLDRIVTTIDHCPAPSCDIFGAVPSPQQFSLLKPIGAGYCAGARQPRGRYGPVKHAEPHDRAEAHMKFWIAAVAAWAALLSAPANAEDWPAKPVRIVVPWSPGGSADLLGRMVADHLSKAFHQTFFVENRPGASGLIGSAAVAHAEPDGYNLVISGIPSHVVAPASNPNAGFDPLKDFTHIAYLGGSPIVLTAHSSLGIKSLHDLLAKARADKTGMGYVSPGVGSLGNLVAEDLARKESIKLEHIPYKGGSQAAQDLIGGQVKLGCMTWSQTSPHFKTGVLVPLAVSSAKRMPGFPDLPTFKDLGYADLVTTTWWSLSGPAGMPKDIVQKINREVNKMLEDPHVLTALEPQAIETEQMSPEQFTTFVASEIRKWGPLAKAVIRRPNGG
jgi:tripartite-type tricarboxylate transporter receptor subunit TctC